MKAFTRMIVLSCLLLTGFAAARAETASGRGQEPETGRRRRVSPVSAQPTESSDSSSAESDDKEKKKVNEPEMTVESFTVEAVRLTEADLLATVELYNPGSSVTISNLKFKVSLNDVESGEGRYEEKITLPDKASITLNLPVTVDLTALPGVGAAGVLKGVKLDYEIKAEFDVSVMIFKKHVKKTMTGDIPLQAALPRITLPRISLPNILFP